MKNVAQHLRLGSGGVADQENVDVSEGEVIGQVPPSHLPLPLPSQSSPVLQHLLHSSQHHGQDGPLDVEVAVDGGGQ